MSKTISPVSTAPESAKPSTADDSIIDRTLSTVSKMYDLDGDGELDDAELAMRKMDTSGRGYLTNEKIYALMKEQLETQKQLFRFKKVMIGLAAMVVILALSNLGTSFAAAYIAKDTTTNDNEELVNARTKETLGTQTTSDSFEIQRATTGSDGRRKLCTNEGGDVRECETDSYLSMDGTEAERMLKKCGNSKTVNLKRTWNDESFTIINICPSFTGTFRENGKSILTNGNNEELTIEEVSEGNYRLDGDGLTQNEGNICDNHADCDDEFSCEIMDDVSIASCENRCRRLRIARHRLPACYSGCMQPICQA